MKIDQPDEDFVDIAQVKLELQKFINQKEPWQVPPCPNCTVHTQKKCTPECEDAAIALSIDPVLYPIEKNVVALVYELNATRLFKSCWSCEGHMKDGNVLWKVPQVCFYSQAAIYPKLISSYLGKLFIRKKITYQWNIFLSEISQSIYPTYCIRPDLNTENEPHLGELQKDLLAIANKLHLQLKNEATELLKSMS